MYESEPLHVTNADRRNEQYKVSCLQELVDLVGYQWETIAGAAYERDNPNASEIPNQYVRIMRWMHLTGDVHPPSEPNCPRGTQRQDPKYPPELPLPPPALSRPAHNPRFRRLKVAATGPVIPSRPPTHDAGGYITTTGATSHNPYPPERLVLGGSRRQPDPTHEPHWLLTHQAMGSTTRRFVSRPAPECSPVALYSW